MSQLSTGPAMASLTEAFGRDGFVVVPGMFDTAEMRQISTWTDEVQAGPETPGRAMMYFEPSLLIPGQRVLQRVENFCPFHAGFAALCDGTRELITRIVDSEFAQWRSLMPKRTRTVLADASQLAEAITRAGKICGRNEAVRLEFGRAEVTITVVHGGTVVSSQRAPVTNKGKPFTIAFSPVYIASMLAGVTGQVRLGFRKPDQAVHISPAEDGDMFRALVMPMRLAG